MIATKTQILQRYETRQQSSELALLDCLLMEGVR